MSSVILIQQVCHATDSTALHFAACASNVYQTLLPHSQRIVLESRLYTRFCYENFLSGLQHCALTVLIQTLITDALPLAVTPSTSVLVPLGSIGKLSASFPVSVNMIALATSLFSVYHVLRNHEAGPVNPFQIRHAPMNYYTVAYGLHSGQNSILNK